MPIEENLNPRSEQALIKEQPRGEVKLHCYPNPATNSFNIEITGLDGVANGEILIFDVIGKLVQTVHVNNEYQNMIIEGLGTGIYQVIYSEKGKFVVNERMVVMK